MDEGQALKALRHGDESALIWFMDRYIPYVNAIIFGILGGAASTSDAEEICSDVFLTLWNNARAVRPGKARAYLSATARNMAKYRLRQAGRELPLTEDVLTASDQDPERELERREQARVVRSAMLRMRSPDREIFLRHYYYGQTLSQIAEEMGMNLSTVKTRLRRGRERLKDELKKGGYLDEDL